MKALFILAASFWAIAALGADTARPNLDLRSADVAKERVRVISSTNNVSVFVPLKVAASAQFTAFVWTNTVYLKTVSVSIDGVRVAEVATMAPIAHKDQTTGVVLLFIGEHRGDAERVAKVLRRS